MKKILTLVMSICMVISAASCNLIVKESDESQFDYPVTVGNIVFEKAPENVVVLSENLADVIVACGYEGKLAARSDTCTQSGLEVLPSVGTPDQPDLDKLKEIAPKLILCDESFDDETKEKIEAMGTEVLVIKPAVNESEIKTLYSNVASILGGGYTGKMKAMATVDEIGGELDAIKNEIVDREVISTMCYIYSTDGEQFKVAWGSDYTSQLFDYAQVTNIAVDADVNNDCIGIDTLLMGNPDTIFCDEGIAEQLLSNSDLSQLSAIVNNRVYTLPNKYLHLQGRTRVLTVDYIVAKTHDFYTPKFEWPEEFGSVEVVIEEDYEAPFEPRENITYGVGESYNQIKYIEERLIQLGYLEGEADNAYTEDTANAVTWFQEMNGLEMTGIADYDTLKVLLSKEAVRVQ